MSTTDAQTSADTARRIEELGRIILAYSEVTDRLQKSHAQLNETVQTLREELSEKNRQLERRNRLAALGEMAAGMAHEIRNPLGGIQLYASLLARDVADRPDSLLLVHKITGGVKRLEALVGQVLQFTREIRPCMIGIDLRAAIDEALEYAAGVMNDRAVTCDVKGPPRLMVTADPLLLGQALLNLLINAADASAESSSGPARVTVEYWSPAPDSGARQFQLVIRDSGPGIPPGILDRIFDPFFTTKDTGTGLGLAIVHRVVEAHDGTIIVTNAPGGGARFELRV